MGSSSTPKGESGPSKSPIPIMCVTKGATAEAGLSAQDQRWAEANGFTGQLGKHLPLPDGSGNLGAILFGMGAPANRPPLALGLAAAALEPGRYSLKGDCGDPTMAALAFGLGAYRFDRFRSERAPVELAGMDGADSAEVDRLVAAATLARDLINTPPNVLGPDAFEAEARRFAKAHKMKVKVTAGAQLLAENFPMIHAVGRASTEAPRLVDLNWGNAGDPKVTLVGKGVTFDTGGLDIKPPAGMLLMKKDMGGAANILGLAHAIIDAKLKVRLRVLLPIVENSIAGNAFRPGDILPSRLGLNVEIGNTDAEGRLILADALALAGEDDPEMIIDMATLTGAARVALGPELPPLYASNDELATELVAHGLTWGDPLWQMPLWQPYEKMLNSKIADINHIASGGFAGSVVAALFLKRFVPASVQWAHLDIYGWAPEPRPGQPFGGADQGIRACYAMLKSRYAAQ